MSEALRLTRTPGAILSGALCAAEMGFTVHAAIIAPRHDSRAKEALLHYILRPPLAQERVSVSADGAVRLGLKRSFSDGTVAVELDHCPSSVGLPLLFLVRGSIQFRSGGILSSAAKWRALVVPEEAEPTSRSKARGTEDGEGPAKARRSTWRPWSELFKRSIDIDVTRAPSVAGRCSPRRS